MALAATLLVTLAAAGLARAVRQHAFNITALSVPAQARAEAELECRYDADFTVLKFWKGRQEFFRYRPGEAPSTRTFPALGVGAVQALACGPAACRLRLTGLAREASGLYRCDIERERPPYRFAARAAHMLVSAEGGGGGSGGGGPALSGVRREYGAGDTLAAACAGAPDSRLRWYVNGQEQAGGAGELRLEATRLGFAGVPPELVVQCAEFAADGRLLGSSSARARWRELRAAPPAEQRAQGGAAAARRPLPLLLPLLLLLVSSSVPAR